MSKSLEALKIIKEKLCCGCEQECCACPYSSETITIEKELKALEIIKNKYLDPHDFVLCYYTMNNEKWIDYEEYKKAYLNYYENDEYMLTQEEYDLLKEVLL